MIPTAAAPTSTDAPMTQPPVREPERFSGHRVQLEIFDGPLDLLLYLIRAHRYDICDIPISDITRQFVEFLVLMDAVDLEYAGDFLVTAATLMQIKSRMLLPKMQSANEDALEAEKGDDPRAQLVERLLEYQRFQNAAEQLKEKREQREKIFARATSLQSTLDALNESSELEIAGETLSLQNVSSFDLLKALQRVLDRLSEAPVALVRREPFTINERMRAVLSRIRGGNGASFGALCEDCQSRLEVVITFLSLLELIRRSRIIVEQARAFDEIIIRMREI